MIYEKELRTGNLYATIRNQQVVVTGVDTINKFVRIAPSSDDLDMVNKNDNSIIFEDLYPIDITVTKISQLGLMKDPPLSIPVASDNTVKFTWDDKLNQLILVDSNHGIIGKEIK